MLLIPRLRHILLALGLLLGAASSQEANDWDIVVVGSEPEAIAAAVSAAEEGASTLLITGHDRLGGLFVLGELNVLDLRTQPVNLQKGLFERWWNLVGRGHSFDVRRAQRAFERLLDEAGVTVRTGADEMVPVMEGRQVVGVRSGDDVFHAGQVIDGTADMDFGALAGAGYTVGFESLGLKARMVDTLVFRIDGVDWQALRRGVRERGRDYAIQDEWVAWGHFGGYPAAYRAQEDGIRLRGLNLGLQEDGSVLVNALLIHDIDPFDSASIAEGRARAEREAPRVVAYLAEELPGFANATYSGAAQTLYIRESRHLQAQCTLTVDDVMDNRVTPLDIAAGGYPLDVQILTRSDTGFVFGAPEIYGVQLCVAVPQDVSGLWVVGKAAGYDPIAASSARVVPFGMNVAEAVGVAAARAVRAGAEPAQFAADEAQIAGLRERLLERGAYLPPVAAREPVGPSDHPHYGAYRLMLSRGLALGGYSNDPRLHQETTALSFVYLLSNVLERFFGLDGAGTQLVALVGTPEGPLTPENANHSSRAAACLLNASESGEIAVEELVGAAPGDTLSRGAAYEVAAALIEALREE